MKFGGSSVADAERILAVGRIVAESVARSPAVVVSALGGVTDLLERAVAKAQGGDAEGLERLLADLQRIHRWALGGAVEDSSVRHDLGLEVDRLFEELRQRLRSIRVLGEATARACDAVLATGEDLASRIVAASLRCSGLAARWIDSRRVLRTDRRFGGAAPDLEEVQRSALELLHPAMAQGELPILGGFVGSDSLGDTTTLGRGGSDTSAAVLGCVMGAEEIQIWTDVDGLMSADPRLVPQARTLPRVSFAEAAELAFYGARVLHPDSIFPAVLRRIPVRVLNSLRPRAQGTVIVESDGGAYAPVASVASRSGVAVLRVLGERRADDRFLGRVIEALRDQGVLPDLVLATEAAVKLVLPCPVALEPIERALGVRTKVEFSGERAIVCVVGAGLERSAEFRARVMGELAALQPEVLAYGTSATSLAAVVPEARLEEVVRALHRRFFEQGEDA